MAVPVPEPPHKTNMVRADTFRKSTYQRNTSVAVSLKKKADPSKNILLALTFGAINAVMTIPCMYGYATIIFGSAIFKDSGAMPALSKLVLFSSAVHQLIFSVMSTLPFAIGQVQDAGLIFLCQMTASVAMRLADRDTDVILSTAVVTTSTATIVLGFFVVIIGKMRMARFVSYLPMPVVGGYLAFIGYFCLEAGLSLCTNLEYASILDFAQLADPKTLALALPGLLCGLLLFWIGRRFTHFAIMPCVMLAIPLLFYIGLGLSEYNLQDARDAGLVGSSDHEPARWYEAFSFFKFDLVEWSVLPYQIPVFLGMVVVVAFSSSLDVAAIEMDMGTPLDTNSELVTVGWSNVISGLFGGFTGSYIFSQTIFTYRTKCWSRLVGWVVCISELGVFMLRIDPLTYVPLFFFGAMLIFIAWDLMFEWLIEVHHKLLPFESATLLITFVSIQALGLNLGLLVGVAVAGAGFVISYASQTVYTMQRVNKSSRVLRPAVERRTLQLYRDKILCLELRGELFFGSASGVLEQVKMFLGADDAAATAAAANAAAASPKDTDPEGSPLLGSGVSSAYDAAVETVAGNGAAAPQDPSVNRGEAIGVHLRVPSLVVFDCKKLNKIDASAARGCFLPLQKLSEQDKICVAYAGLTPTQEHFLKVHGALDGDNVAVFPQLDAALDWCERSLILAIKQDNANGFCKLAHFGRRNSNVGSFAGSLADLLRQMLELPAVEELSDGVIMEYCLERHFEVGQTIFLAGEASTSLFIVLQGRVSLSAGGGLEHQITLRPGGIFGYADMFLEMERTFGAAATTSCTLAEFTKEAMERMLWEQPRLLAFLQRAVIQFSSLELANEPV